MIRDEHTTTISKTIPPPYNLDDYLVYIFRGFYYIFSCCLKANNLLVTFFFFKGRKEYKIRPPALDLERRKEYKIRPAVLEYSINIKVGREQVVKKET